MTLAPLSEDVDLMSNASQHWHVGAEFWMQLNLGVGKGKPKHLEMSLNHISQLSPVS